MVLSSYAKHRIVALHDEGHKAPTIAMKLREEGTHVSRVGVHKFLRVYKTTHTIQQRSSSGCPSKIVPEIKVLVEQQMNLDALAVERVGYGAAAPADFMGAP